MKKTIREELEEKYIRTVLVNDNALLIYTENDTIENRVDVKVRYVQGTSIKEQYLTHLTKGEFIHLREELIEINLDRTAIAMYRKREEELQLDRLYSLEEHSFSVDDFIDLEYQRYFPNNELSESLIKKRGTRDGKHKNRTTKSCNSRRN